MISTLNKHWINEIANIYPIYTKKRMKNNAAPERAAVLVNEQQSGGQYEKRQENW